MKNVYNFFTLYANTDDNNTTAIKTKSKNVNILFPLKSYSIKKSEYIQENKSLFHKHINNILNMTDFDNFNPNRCSVFFL